MKNIYKLLIDYNNIKEHSRYDGICCVQVSSNQILDATQIVRTHHSRYNCDRPEWLVHDLHRGGGGYDANFPWVLIVRNLPVSCGQLRWEQFISGFFAINFVDGTMENHWPAQEMASINPRARRFANGWSDDILGNMTPGPRAANSSAYRNAMCMDTAGPNPLGTMQRVRRRETQPNWSYEFRDAPGLRKNFGDTINGKLFYRVTWSLSFAQKLWRAGESSPFFTIRFDLTGVHELVRTGESAGTQRDTRAIRRT